MAKDFTICIGTVGQGVWQSTEVASGISCGSGRQTGAQTSRVRRNNPPLFLSPVYAVVQEQLRSGVSAH